MNILLILMIPVTLLLVATFVSSFLWATGNGQFDDLETPAHRMLCDENLESSTHFSSERGKES